MEPRDGAIYLLKGGHVLRCISHGKKHWNDDVTQYATFSCVQGEVPDAPGKYTTFYEEIIRELTKEDIPMLENRVMESLARDLKHEADDCEFVIKELRGEP